jgi:hypothetical protein
MYWLSWFLVTMAWYILMLLKEKDAFRHGRRASANIMNKYLWTAGKGWSFSFGSGKEG